MFFTPTLLNFSVFLNNTIETFIYLSKHLVDLGIDLGITCLKNRFGKLWEEKLVVRMVNGIGDCHVPVPVVENK